MIQTVEMSTQEKFKMYNKCTKKQLIEMLIEANKHLDNRPLTWVNEGFVPREAKNRKLDVKTI